MKAKQAEPEKKYNCSGGDYYLRGMGHVRTPLSENIRVRTGWFKTQPRLRLKVGQQIGFVTGPLPEEFAKMKKEPEKFMSVDKEVSFPYSPKEDRFSIAVGRFGKFLGSSEVSFLDDPKKIKELVMAAVNELRLELKKAEEASDGYEYLSNRYKKYYEIVYRDRVTHTPLWKASASPFSYMYRQEYLEFMAKHAESYNPIPSSRSFSEIMAGEKPVKRRVSAEALAMRRTSEKEKDDGRAEYYDDVNTFAELRARAKLIEDILHEISEGLPLLYSIAFPDSLGTVPLIGTTIRFYRNDGEEIYSCVASELDIEHLMIKREFDREAVLLGNQAKILVRPVVDH